MNVTAAQLSSPNVNAPTTEITRSNESIKSAVAQVTPTIPSTKVDLNYPASHAPVSSLEPLSIYGIEARNVKTVHEETSKLNKVMEATQNGMKSVWDQLRTDLEKSNPALATKDFGFSLDADGNFVVLERSDTLSENDMRTLTETLNESVSLKMLANDFARLTMEYVKADYVSQGLGKFDLNMSNFHSTIDFERMLDYEQTGAKRWNSTWYNQVWNKGVERNIVVEYEWARK